MKTVTSIETRLATAAALALCLALPQPSRADPAHDRVVFPTGSFPLDVQNVQAALDEGGTILLKATNTTGLPTSFNFGPSDASGGWVEFHADAALIGERAADATTTIVGGWTPVSSFGGASSMAVRNLTFRSSFDGAVLLLGGSDTQVTGVHVVHAVGNPRDPNDVTTYAEALVVGYSGRVLIEDNVVEDIDADLGFGVSQFRASGPVLIRGNTLGGTGYGTIESSFNVNRATGAPAAVSINDNHLRPGPAPNGFGVGIEINGQGAYYVAGNDILIESPNGLGVYALGAPKYGIAAMVGPVIEKNRVRMQPRLDMGPVYGDGIDLIGTVSLAYVGQNSVEGGAFSALGEYDISGGDLAFNTYVGNQVATFAPLVATVFLDSSSHDNVLKGFSGTVVDFGTNNHVTGANAGGPGTGAQVSEAARRRAAAAQAAIRLLRQDGAMEK